MGQEFKLSLHEPRPDQPARAHISISSEAKVEVGLESRFLHVWPRPNDPLQLHKEFHILFPTSELRLGVSDEDTLDDVHWLPAAPPEGAIEVIMATGPMKEHDNLVRGRQEHVLSVLDISDSRRCWILRGVHSSLDAGFVANFEQAKSRVRNRTPDFVRGEVNLEEPGTRGQIVMARGGIPFGWIEAAFTLDRDAA